MPVRPLTFWTVVASMGPGLMVCFADTDGPCLITAAKSGADFKYDLLLLQIVLIPILYAAQDLTSRLAIVRKKGLIGIVREDGGLVWGWIIAVPLLIACFAGLVSEYVVIGQMMLYWGVPLSVTSALVTLILVGLALTGSYHLAETVGLLFGSLQVLLFITMFFAGVKPLELLTGLGTFHFLDTDYLLLVTANIGAVIMPWMLAYQQSAVCNKVMHGEPSQHLMLTQIDTAVGSVLTQGVMSAMLVTVAGAKGSLTHVDGIDDIMTIFKKIIGNDIGAELFLSFSIIGACMVAAIVQTLAAAWVFEDLFVARSEPVTNEDLTSGDVQPPSSVVSRVLQRVKSRLLYYTMYILVCAGSFIITISFKDVTFLSVLAEFLNGILMPPVVFALWYASAYGLPKYRLQGVYKWTLFVAFLICSLFCFATIPTIFMT